MVALLKMPRIEKGESWAERRTFERTAAQGIAQGYRLDHTIQARRNPRMALDLQDLSLGGVAARTNHPVQNGESLTLVFPPRGMNPSWNATGRVIRCVAETTGYHVAIEFDRRLAA